MKKKILVLAMPFYGHINPVLRVVKSLRKQGNEVYFITTAPFIKAVEEIGGIVHLFPEDISVDLFKNEKQVLSLALASVAFSACVLPFVLQIAKKIEPDYIVHDSFSLYGKIVGRRLTIPAINVMSSFVIDLRLILRYWHIIIPDVIFLFKQPLCIIAFMRSYYSLFRRYGVSAPFILDIFLNKEDVNIIYSSPYIHPHSSHLDNSFQFMGLDSIQKIRRKSSHFPIIYISLGTVFNTNMSFYKQCVRVLKNSEFDIHMAIGPHIDQKSLSSSSNIHMYSHADQLSLLKKASLFISHGGINSIHESIAYEVPLILFPQIHEQKINATRIEELGCGVYIKHIISDSKLLRVIKEVLQSKTMRKNLRKAHLSYSPHIKEKLSYQ